jgi:hypothetical protein
MVQFLLGARDFSHLDDVQTGSGACTASYQRSAGVFFHKKVAGA